MKNNSEKCKDCGGPLGDRPANGYCFECMCDAEAAATCPHGFLVGCPVCIAALQEGDKE